MKAVSVMACRKPKMAASAINNGMRNVNGEMALSVKANGQPAGIGANDRSENRK
jgi:hypothetical protein